MAEKKDMAVHSEEAFSDKVVHSDHFYGNEISEYGMQNHRVDYATLCKSFDMVFTDDIWKLADDWNIVNGELEEDGDICQYFIIGDKGYDILTKWTDELVYYSESLNMYVLGVTHYGTPWDYVLTGIRVES